MDQSLRVRRSSPTVAVEVLRIGLHGGVLEVSTSCADVDGASPDHLALRLAELDADNPASICHSTSWRYEAGSQGQSRVVLTYIALPSLERGLPVEAAPVMASDDPLYPTPDGMHEHHVVAHAIRHVVRLADTDPTVGIAAAQPEAAQLWADLRARADALVVVPCNSHDHQTGDHEEFSQAPRPMSKP